MNQRPVQVKVLVNQMDHKQAQTSLGEESEVDRHQSFFHSFIEDSMKKVNNQREHLLIYNNKQDQSTLDMGPISRNSLQYCRLYTRFKHIETSQDIMRGNFQRLMSQPLQQNSNESQKTKPKCLIALFCPKIEDMNKGLHKKRKSKPYTHLCNSIINRIELSSQIKNGSANKLKLQNYQHRKILGKKKKCITQNASTYSSALPSSNPGIYNQPISQKQNTNGQNIIDMNRNRKSIAKIKSNIYIQTAQYLQTAVLQTKQRQKVFFQKKDNRLQRDKFVTSDEFRLLKKLLLKQKYN